MGALNSTGRYDGSVTRHDKESVTRVVMRATVGNYHIRHHGDTSVARRCASFSASRIDGSCTGDTCAYTVRAYVVMADAVMAYVVMAHIVMTQIFMAYTVMAHIVMAIVMAHVVLAHIVMAYIVMPI